MKRIRFVVIVLVFLCLVAFFGQPLAKIIFANAMGVPVTFEIFVGDTVNVLLKGGTVAAEVIGVAVGGWVVVRFKRGKNKPVKVKKNQIRPESYLENGKK